MSSCDRLATDNPVGSPPSAGKPGDTDQLLALGRLLMGTPPKLPLDWQALLALARWHRVSPLLYWRFKEWRAAQDVTPGDQSGQSGGLDTPPEWVIGVLRRDFAVAAIRCMRAEQQLAELIAALRIAGVPVLVLKGATLAEYYPHAALRPYADLDILVPKALLDTAEDTLSQLGYHYPRRGAMPSHHLPLMRTDDGLLPVEVHWRLTTEAAADSRQLDDLWLRAVPWAMQNQPAQRLQPVDMALHICRHAVLQHQLHLGLIPLCDLALVTRCWERTQWQALVRQAVHYESVRPVLLMLALIERVLDVTAPPDVITDLEHTSGQPLPEDLEGGLLQLRAVTTTKAPVRLALGVADGPVRSRLGHALRSLFLARDDMAAVYNLPPNSLRIWLTYVRRPVDVARRHGLSTWRALVGDPTTKAVWAWELWLVRWLQEEGRGR